MANRSVSIPATLTELERRGASDWIFQGDLRHYARTVWPRMTNLAG